jgi:hypothetical protein
MGLHKGMTNNPNGRPKGSQNLINKEIREKILELLESNFEKIQADLDKLEPKDRIKVITDLMPYILPKLQNTSIAEHLEPREIIIKGISTEELNEFLDDK